MPHIILEYSENLAPFAPDQALREAHDAVLKTGQAQPPRALKGRAVKLETHLMADGISGGFVHVTLRLLPGRSLEIRKALIETVLAAIAPTLPTGFPVSLTGEVVEIEQATYAKHEFHF